MSVAFLVLSSFLASAVEMVEALTIILATGITRGWRSTLLGVGAALLALGVLIAVFGPAIVTFVPIDVLRLVIGTLLLLFGLQWLRKAILRAAGLKALHDENAIYTAEVQALASAGAVAQEGIDWPGFTVAFKGVFLEGLEVAFIVVTFGTSAGSLTYATAGALLALVLVFGIGAVAHRPLANVPENTLKLSVGLLLTAFGTFWAGEGVGIEWPGADLALVGLLVLYAAFALGITRWLRAVTADEVGR